MKHSLILFILLLQFPFSLCGQIDGLYQIAYTTPGLLNAISENQQQFNPAASHSRATNGLRFYSNTPIQVPGLFSGGFNAYYKFKTIHIYHELGGIYHISTSQIQTVHALALSLYPHLQIGIGLQLAFYAQPKYYGSISMASGRFGMQYQAAPHHFLSFVIYQIGQVELAQMAMEHVWKLDQQVSFAQGLLWHPPYLPTAYISICQQLSSVSLRFSCGVYPQFYSYTLTFTSDNNRRLIVGQSWNKGQGLALQLGLNFR
jgi:hypothetical protein